MAIAFRAAGARLKTIGGGAKNVPMPAGVVANDLLIMFSTQDSRTDETTPAGWNVLMTAGRYDQSAPHPWPRTTFFWRIATGSEGANVSVTYPSGSYPSGTPNILSFIAAWSGTHLTTPLNDWEPDDTTNPSTTVDHPQINVTSANSWLVTFRAASALVACTFTDSVGGDAERVDDTDGFGELSVALYDSNATVSTGTSALRQTTASNTPYFGNNMSTLAIRPPTAAGSTQAPAGLASATGTAYNPSVTVVQPTWAFCVSGAQYSFAIDWNADGDFTDPNEEVSQDITSAGISVGYGRDQERQLSPTSVGTMAFNLNNSGRTYSPENVSSPLFGDLDPARETRAQVTYSGVTYPLFRGRIDDYNVSSDRKSRTASFTFLDGQALLQGTKLSTALYTSIRSGAAVSVILDEIGWTGPRDIDLGASFFPYWWVDGTDAFAAMQEIVRSEGPPAMAYQAPDGTFVFRDRHHRIVREHSVISQGRFAAEAIDCAAPPVTGFNYTAPFTYAHGWRDIINKAQIEVGERTPSLELEVVWSSESTTVVGPNETISLHISSSEPFTDAQDLIDGTDIVYAAGPVVTATFNRTSGQSIILRITSTGGTAVITYLQVRARPVTVQRTINISQVDSASVGEHGDRSYPDTVPWVNVHDALAVASKIVFRYAQRKPIIQLRVASKDPSHFNQVVTRTVSDRITVQNDEMGLNSDFFVERVTHDIRRIWSDQEPVHSVVLGCEKEPEAVESNPFTFDKRGAGFDEGVFDPLSSDDPASVFTFDDPIRGQFDLGVFAT